ncbi:SH3 domain-containing protein [bacterium]|nr:SH3 domain-containing protein [bacterium]
MKHACEYAHAPTNRPGCAKAKQVETIVAQAKVRPCANLLEKYFKLSIFASNEDRRVIVMASSGSGSGNGLLILFLIVMGLALLLKNDNRSTGTLTTDRDTLLPWVPVQPVLKPGQYGGAINRNDVNVRSGAGTNYDPPIGKVNIGDTVIVLNKPGYISPGPIGDDPEGSWVRAMNAAGEIGYIVDSFVDRFKVPKYIPYFLESGQPVIRRGEQGGVIKRNTVFVRNESSTNSEEIAKVYLGDTVKVLSVAYGEINGNPNGGWLQISNADNKVGYIVQQLVDRFEFAKVRFAFSPEETAKNAFTGYVKHSKNYTGVEIKSGPGIDNPTIDFVPANFWLWIQNFNEVEEGIVDHKGKIGRWLKVYSNYGDVGYIMEKYVERGFSSFQVSTVRANLTNDV